MTAVATSQGADRIGDLGAPTDGYSASFLGAMGITVAGALFAAGLFVGSRRLGFERESSDEITPSGP